MPVLARRWLGGAGDSVRSENKESAQGPVGRSVPPLGVMPMAVTPGDRAGIAEKGTALTGTSAPPAGPGRGLGLQATEQARSQAPTVHVPGGALPCWAASGKAEPGPGSPPGCQPGCWPATPASPAWRKPAGRPAPWPHLPGVTFHSPRPQLPRWLFRHLPESLWRGHALRDRTELIHLSSRSTTRTRDIN